jgi:hypothetical protein
LSVAPGPPAESGGRTEAQRQRRRCQIPGKRSTDSILSLTDSARSLAGNTPQCFTVLRLKLRHTNRETESLIGQKVLHPFWPSEQSIFLQKNAVTNGPEKEFIHRSRGYGLEAL